MAMFGICNNVVKRAILSHFVRRYGDHKSPFFKTWNVISKRSSDDLVYPEHADIVIIGGGIIGASTAYWLKTRAAEGLSVVVLEKDFTYEKSQKHLRNCLLTQHFSLPENYYLSQFGAEFIRNAKTHLGEDVNTEYFPTSSLVLASDEYAEKLEENVTLLREYGAHNELLTPDEIKKSYPWINTADVKLGTIGIESEGTFNGWELLKGFVKKSKELGTIYVNAEVVGFDLVKQRDILMEGVAPGSFERIMNVIYRTPDNEEYSLKFAGCVLAAGFDSRQIAEKAKIGTGDGLLTVPLPIDKRNHDVYSVESKTPLGLNTPIIMDTSGLWLQKIGLENNLLCGCLPSLDPEYKNVTKDETLRNLIEPALQHRIPSFSNATLHNYSSLSYDCNTFDNTGILGTHPYHNSLYIATGFGQQGCQHAPGIGKAMAELIIDSRFMSIDLTRFEFDRILTDRPLIEFNVY